MAGLTLNPLFESIPNTIIQFEQDNPTKRVNLDDPTITYNDDKNEAIWTFGVVDRQEEA